MLPTASKTSTQDPLDYLSRGWFPVNTGLLKEIQKKLKDGAYNQDRETFIRDIKNDFALFGHCLKGLGAAVPSADHSQNPIEIMRAAEIEDLRRMIEVPIDTISPHTFDPHVKHQIARVKHFVVSCSTAEAIGEKKGLDSDVAFSCALVRQIGMTLVAFNYPRIYAQAVASLKTEDEDLERVLKKVLGFSPTQLGVRATLGWNRYVPMKVALGENTPNAEHEDPLFAFRERDDSHKQGEELKHICEIGETLARLNDVEHYPGTAKKWDQVKSQVCNLLGPDGMQIIGSKVREHQVGYLAMAPDVFRTEIAPERNVRTTNAQYVKQLIAENSFLKGLPSAMRGEFEKMYQHAKRGQVATEGLSLLVGRITSLLGFERGCIYLADMKRMRLVPTLRVGDAQLAEFRPLSLGDTAYTNPIVDAMNSSTLLRQENVVFNDEVVSHISGTFGNHEKGGVLHLQMGRELVAADRSVSLLYFKAVRQALNDCLGLR